MELSQQFESAMEELPPRYSRSGILRDIYRAFDAAVKPLLEKRLHELELCDDFATMPQSLLDAYCTYFNVDMSLDESTRRSMCAWRMTTIGGYYRLSDMLEALGFSEYRIKKNGDGSLTAVLYSRRNADGTAMQVTDADAEEFRRVFAEYGPAHLQVGTMVYRVVTFGADDLLFGNQILFGNADESEFITDEDHVDAPTLE
ncbi:MAG: hypothetical protein Q4F79_07420 [Eubacteriales bacterium]|nr:hypothetical protein [Eubacteriales bacterium]